MSSWFAGFISRFARRSAPPLPPDVALQVFAAALLAALIAIRIWDPVPVEVLRLRTFDLYQLLMPRDRGTAPVAVVDIDEASLQEVGQWPWPRTEVASLVDNAFAAGAVAVAFDVVFAEPDRMSVSAMASLITEYDRELAERLKELPTNDKVFARTLRRADRVVLAQAVSEKRLAYDVGPVHVPSVATLGRDPRKHLTTAAGMVRNIPVLAEAAAGVGVISLWPSPDTVVRNLPLIVAVNDHIYPALSLELLRIGVGEATYVVETTSAGIESVVLGGRRIPTDAQGKYWIHFGRTRPDTFISASNIVTGGPALDALAGKLVLVGTSAVGLGDIKATPLDGAVPGVEVHAQALETILSGAHLLRLPEADLIELIATALIGGCIIFLTRILRPLWTMALGAGTASLVVAGALYAFAKHQLLLDPSFTLGASFFLFGVLVFANYMREERDKRFIRHAFSHYLAPQLVDQLAKEQSRLALGGETRNVSVLFCDIFGFTRIAEGFANDPQGLTRLINRCLTPLSDAVLAHGGTIDKYIGDSVMAFWNAPLQDPLHPASACAAALDMTQALDALNEYIFVEGAKTGEPSVILRVGIGINTGSCLVGNLGTDTHFNYSVLGDTVNLAARLEALTRYYDASIIIGSATAACLNERFALLPLDTVRVKGKTSAERIYAVLGRDDVAGQGSFARLRASQERVLAAHVARDWDEAEAVLKDNLDDYTAFGLGRLHAILMKRTATLRESPPPSNWDGVFDPGAKIISETFE